MRLWLVGKVSDEPGEMWEFQGIFSTEDLARSACRDRRYFVSPVTLDESLPDESFDMPGCYYPLAG